MNPALDRHHPHLRLTAAIVVAGFVAILAALGGADSHESPARRGELSTCAANGLPRTLLAMGIVAADLEVVDHVHLGRMLGHGLVTRTAATTFAATSPRALDRALRRLTLAAASPERVAFLRTTVLPPPQA
jgi:hypothetical protein